MPETNHRSAGSARWRPWIGILVLGALGLGGPTACDRSDPETALRAIRRWEDARTLAGDSLLVHLRDGAIEVRAAAARAVGRIGDPRGRGALEHALLHDPHEHVRSEAAFALGILGDPAALPTLARALENERDVETTAQCALAVGRLGEKSGSPLVVALLDNPDPRIRECSVEALALLADSTTVDALLAATDDPLESVVWRAAYALEKIPGSRQVQRLISLTSSTSAPVRRAAVRSLGRLQSRDALPRLCELVEERPGDVPLRIRLADAIGRIGAKDPDAIEALGTLLTDEDFGVRTMALQSAARLQAIALLPRILDLRADPTVDVRAAAYEAASACLEGRNFDVLRRGLDDPSELVRASCLRELGRSIEDAAISMLADYADTSGSLLLRMAAIEGLGAAGDRCPVHRVAAALRDRSPFVAAVAATALAAVGDSSVVADLLEACDRTDDHSGDIRLAAFSTLGRLGDRRAVERLRRALADATDVRLRIAARDALEQLLDPEEAALLPDVEALRAQVHPVHRSPAQPPLVVRSRARQLVLDTDRGHVIIDLFGDDAPQTVESFARLAEKGFFDGLDFHRVVPDFVVQGGDPTGTGWGDAGYTLRSEWSPRSYERGTVGVAHSGKDTGSCQFFVAKAPQPHLDARYTIFGEVVAGMDVVDRIQRGDRFRASVVWQDDAP